MTLATATENVFEVKSRGIQREKAKLGPQRTHSTARAALASGVTISVTFAPAPHLTETLSVTTVRTSALGSH
jgi:hypothetical protein